VYRCRASSKEGIGEGERLSPPALSSAPQLRGSGVVDGKRG